MVCQQTLVRLARQYGFEVRLVAGEADEFCVRLARQTPDSLLLSLDGDFLIHVGENGSFVPLYNFPLDWNDALSLRVYSKTREAVGLKREGSMIELAALLGEGIPLTVPQCIACINQKHTLDYISQATLNRYSTAYTISIEESTSTHALHQENSASMVGRLTELFFYDDTPVHWLPLFPLTNPPRKSPWLVSRTVRQAAYYELRKQGLIKGDWVIEMIRRGQRMVEEAVPIEDIEVNLKDTNTRGVFLYAMEILMEISSREEIKVLPVFAGMFSLMTQAKISSVHVVLTPIVQYLTHQYQSMVYSLIIYLQSRFPSVEDIPEFSALLDLPRFKVALTLPPAGREASWTAVLNEMNPTVQALWRTSNPPAKPHQKKQRKSTTVQEKETSPHIDEANPFSIFSSIPPLAGQFS